MLRDGYGPQISQVLFLFALANRVIEKAKNHAEEFDENWCSRKLAQHLCRSLA